MHTSFQNKIKTPGTQAIAIHNRLDALPIGATQLDSKGRILHRMTATGFAQDPRCSQMAGESFFHQFCMGTPLSYLEEIYEDGVREGELYHFVEMTIGQGDRTRDLTLFLYYHASMDQGWVFIETHSEYETPEIDMRRAA